ncbi:hypothetical protein [Anaerolinea sp.]|uniref:hypothetical protein n=1 Tax=Anaerolinea sp. TaxID=1872519 RepID=UPI002ACE434D|nr:hypothetical protein [Anaerolinea sp.]
MRRFLLVRQKDVSGVSGTGIVAEGVEFSDGMAVLHWLREPYGLNIFASVMDLIAVHGHGGNTYIEWVDEKNYELKQELQDIFRF